MYSAYIQQDSQCLQHVLVTSHPTLLSLNHTGELCCLSMSSRTFLYQDSGVVSVILQLNVWPQIFSSFWHCSNSFLLLLCAALQPATCVTTICTMYLATALSVLLTTAILCRLQMVCKQLLSLVYSSFCPQLITTFYINGLHE